MFNEVDGLVTLSDNACIQIEFQTNDARNFSRFKIPADCRQSKVLPRPTVSLSGILSRFADHRLHLPFDREQS